MPNLTLGNSFRLKFEILKLQRNARLQFFQMIAIHLKELLITFLVCIYMQGAGYRPTWDYETRRGTGPDITKGVYV